jgi:hypothetical protein
MRLASKILARRELASAVHNILRCDMRVAAVFFYLRKRCVVYGAIEWPCPP